MSLKVLKLYNTFTKTLNNVEVAGKVISADSISSQPINGSFYICGPTVYSESHVGHALTYIRADLFRRFMKSAFNLNLFTVMNITDIDDKILEKTRQEFPETAYSTTEPSLHPFNQISEKYCRSFMDDMNSIKIIPADMYMRVSRQMNLITAFIRRLESNGNAYQTQDGDIRFRTSSVIGYKTRLDLRRGGSDAAVDNNPDFVLWKKAKPNEPQWVYESSSGSSKLLGRPGWHVQCSAISGAIFGDRLDFHFGGKDLIFPHHYNEEACSCAYHLLDTSQSLHVWANHWLHSGHLVLQDRKMSKSLGNVVPIKHFLDRSSQNALRLMCIDTHYRSDIEFGESLLNRLKATDHRISAFVAFIKNALEKEQETRSIVEPDDISERGDIQQSILQTQENIVEGLCDDFDTVRGLDSILSLSKEVYARGANNLNPTNLLSIWSTLREWCNTCGLEYGGLMTHSANTSDEVLSKTLFDFRAKVRSLALSELKSCKTASQRDVMISLLKECDTVRAKMDEFGFVLRDPKASDL